MLAAVEDVHHRHRKPHCSRPAQVGVERQFRSHGRGPGHRHRNAKDCVGPQLALGRRPVEIDHQTVDFGLPRRVHANELRGDLLIHVGDGLEHSLAAVPLFVAVAQLEGFVLARGCPGGHRGRSRDPVVEGDMDPHSWVAPRVENLQSTHRSNLPSHGFIPFQLLEINGDRHPRTFQFRVVLDERREPVPVLLGVVDQCDKKAPRPCPQELAIRYQPLPGNTALAGVISRLPGGFGGPHPR